MKDTEQTASRGEPNLVAHNRAQRLSTIFLIGVIVCGLASVALLQRRIDRLRPPTDVEAEVEELYVSGEAARRLSMSFNGLVADWYWMRALQYTGRKLLKHEGDLQIDDLSSLNLKLLAPLLDRATTLDPQYMAAYEFGAMVLPSIDRAAAERLLTKGIRENPEAWRLHHQLGFIQWKAGRFREAREAYEAGARLPGAPAWMRAMAAQMEAEGGSRRTATEMYARIYANAEDEQTKAMAGRRLLWLRSLDERDALRAIIANHQRQHGRCPASFAELAARTKSAGFTLDETAAPLDPSGVPYVFVHATCDVELDPRTSVPRR